MAQRYPLAPFFEVTGWNMTKLQNSFRSNGPEYRIRKDRGVTEAMAERLALEVGRHPFEIWPEMVEDRLETRDCDRCGTAFVPVRRKQRWCSPKCRLYNAQKEHQRRKWAADPEWAEAQRERARRYRAETAEYQRAQARLRYQRRKAAA